MEDISHQKYIHTYGQSLTEMALFTFGSVNEVRRLHKQMITMMMMMMMQSLSARLHQELKCRFNKVRLACLHDHDQR